MNRVFFVVLMFLSPWVLADFAKVSAGKKKDVLFVIDDSGSMGDHQENLSQFTESILSSYRGADLQIGITTTSLSNPNSLVGSALSGNLDDIIDKLSHDMRVGTAGDTKEMVFDAVLRALSDPKNKGFLRAGATLDIVIVTDTEDQSEISNIRFLAELSKLKELADIKVSAFIPLSPNCSVEPDAGARVKLNEVLDFFEAKRFDLCGDWSTFQL